MHNGNDYSAIQRRYCVMSDSMMLRIGVPSQEIQSMKSDTDFDDFDPLNSDYIFDILEKGRPTYTHVHTVRIPDFVHKIRERILRRDPELAHQFTFRCKQIRDFFKYYQKGMPVDLDFFTRPMFGSGIKIYFEINGDKSISLSIEAS